MARVISPIFMFVSLYVLARFQYELRTFFWVSAKQMKFYRQSAPKRPNQ